MCDIIEVNRCERTHTHIHAYEKDNKDTHQAINSGFFFREMFGVSATKIFKFYSICI